MKLTDAMITAVASSIPAPRTVRRVQQALKAQYGCVGKTKRVLALLRPSPTVPTPQAAADIGPQGDEARLRRLLTEAEERASKAEERAALAEHREIVHGDLRLTEIYELRQTNAALHRELAASREIANRNIDLHRDLAKARSLISIYEEALRRRGVDPVQLLPND